MTCRLGQLTYFFPPWQYDQPFSPLPYDMLFDALKWSIVSPLGEERHVI